MVGDSRVELLHEASAVAAEDTACVGEAELAAHVRVATAHHLCLVLYLRTVTHIRGRDLEVRVDNAIHAHVESARIEEWVIREDGYLIVARPR